MLEFEEVTKRYGADVRAVDQVSLTVPPGETTVLLGTSGCGKSTLLRLGLGLIAPDRGTVRLAGEPLEARASRTGARGWRAGLCSWAQAGRYSDRRLLAMRREIGYVVQRGGLFPHLTGRENVTIVARHLGWDRPRIETRLRTLCELVRLPETLLSRRPQAMSGGQQQRVSLMRALFLDPELLLLDEPLGALDPLVRRELQQDLRGIFRTLGKTVVLVTHDLHEAAWFGDLVVLMHAGRIVQSGGYAELVERPADDYVRRFVAAQSYDTELALGQNRLAGHDGAGSSSEGSSKSSPGSSPGSWGEAT